MPDGMGAEACWCGRAAGHSGKHIVGPAVSRPVGDALARMVASAVERALLARERDDLRARLASVETRIAVLWAAPDPDVDALTGCADDQSPLGQAVEEAADDRPGDGYAAPACPATPDDGASGPGSLATAEAVLHGPEPSEPHRGERQTEAQPAAPGPALQPGTVRCSLCRRFLPETEFEGTTRQCRRCVADKTASPPRAVTGPLFPARPPPAPLIPDRVAGGPIPFRRSAHRPPVDPALRVRSAADLGPVDVTYDLVARWAGERGIAFLSWDDLPRVNAKRERLELPPFRRKFTGRPIRGASHAGL
jgi:hypothetical protein